jgi:hypothetical protein
VPDDSDRRSQHRPGNGGRQARVPSISHATILVIDDPDRKPERLERPRSCEAIAARQKQ